jgi:hypothetical protein
MNSPLVNRAKRTIGENIADLRRVGKSGSALPLPHASYWAIGRKPNISLTEKVGLGSIMLAARKTPVLTTKAKATSPARSKNDIRRARRWSDQRLNWQTQGIKAPRE